MFTEAWRARGGNAIDDLSADAAADDANRPRPVSSFSSEFA